jgi:hypothetical protein
MKFPIASFAGCIFACSRTLTVSDSWADKRRIKEYPVIYYVDSEGAQYRKTIALERPGTLFAKIACGYFWRRPQIISHVEPIPGKISVEEFKAKIIETLNLNPMTYRAWAVYPDQIARELPKFQTHGEIMAWWLGLNTVSAEDFYVFGTFGPLEKAND